MKNLFKMIDIAMVGLLMSKANWINNKIGHIQVLRCIFDHFFRKLHSIFCDFRYFGSLFSACIGTRGLGVHILRDIGVMMVWLIAVRS